MIRSVFLIFLIFILCSCENEQKEVHPLFYQMSKADSLTCENEIFNEMRKESLIYQHELDEYLWETCADYGSLIKEVLDLQIDSVGEIISSNKSESEEVSMKVVDFFMRFRDDSEIPIKNATPRYFREYLTYSIISSNEIEDLVNRRTEEYVEVKNISGVDPSLVGYYKSSMVEVEKIQRLIDLFRLDEAYIYWHLTRVQIDANQLPDKYEEIFDEVLRGYFKIRNYECQRFLGESYLSLFERAKRYGRKVDVDKLEMLKFYRPVRISNINSAGAIISPPIFLASPISY